MALTRAAGSLARSAPSSAALSAASSEVSKVFSESIMHMWDRPRLLRLHVIIAIAISCGRKSGVPVMLIAEE